MAKINTTAELGRIIQRRRKQLGYTQAFLAGFAGVSTSFLSELENGKETIHLGKALHIIQLLGLDFNIDVRGGYV